MRFENLYDYNSYYTDQAKKNFNQIGFGISTHVRNNSVLNNLKNIFKESNHPGITSSNNTSISRKRRSSRPVVKRGGQRKKPKRTIKKSVKSIKSISRVKKAKKTRPNKIKNTELIERDIFN